MRRSWVGILTAVLVVTSACSTAEDAGSDTTASVPAETTIATAAERAPETTAMAAATTATPATTTAPATTTTPVLVFDDEARARFVAGVREQWERSERTLDAPIPDLTDDEIVAIGAELCAYLAENPLDFSASQAEQAMPFFADAAVIISGEIGITYDPSLLDAGFESQADAVTVMAFRYVGNGEVTTENHALCPEVDPRPDAGGTLFIVPWSVRASIAEDS